jgi:hypothetical protein
VASLDADLQRVIAAWDGLPPAIRRATLALIAQCDWSDVATKGPLVSARVRKAEISVRISLLNLSEFDVNWELLGKAV